MKGMIVLSILVTAGIVSAVPPDLVEVDFKPSDLVPDGVLTNSHGDPVDFEQANSSLNYTSIIENEFLMETLTQLDRENIPERIVHNFGTGAFGYFEVTDDITDICSAKVFSKVGKRTPAAVRFSTTFAIRSEAERDNHGFAVKLYTEEGNFDIVALKFPVFPMKDTIKFPSFVHALKRNPRNNLKDNNTLWDFITLNPESMHFFLYFFTDRGTLYSYRTIPGFGLHTFQLVNKVGEYHFVRFQFIPDRGIKYLTAEEAMRVTDPDYLTRDLYEAIENGTCPTWTLYVQVLNMEDIKKYPNTTDTTRLLPESLYPRRPVGKLILNKNPIDYFSDIEQMAYCPNNIVPGVEGGLGNLFQGRRLSYRDTQYYRLGKNFNKIAVNAPFKKRTYLSRGIGTTDHNGYYKYYPNSLTNGPKPVIKNIKSRLIDIVESPPYNYDQAAEFVRDMPRDEYERLIENISDNLKTVRRFIQIRAIRLLTFIYADLGKRVAQAIQMP